MADIQSLPFIGKGITGSKPRDFWNVPASSDETYADDCRAGRQYAYALIRHMTEDGAPFLLGWVVQAMIEKGRFDGYEVGFLGVIAERAMLSIKH